MYSRGFIIFITVDSIGIREEDDICGTEYTSDEEGIFIIISSLTQFTHFCS